MSNPAYRFSGMPDFVERDGVKPSFIPRISSNWFVQRVGDALSQIPEAKPEHRAEMYRVAREAIEGLRISLSTAVAAFDEVMLNSPPLADPDDPDVNTPDLFTATRPPTVTEKPIQVESEPAPKAVAPAPPKPKKPGETA